MKNKKIIFLFIMIAVLIVSGYVIHKFIIIKEVKMSANFINQKTNLNDVIDASQVIVVGTVKNSESYKTNNVVFTNYTIDIENKLETSSLDIGKQIKVRLTGGQINGVNYTLEKIKRLNKNDKYLFLLKKRILKIKTVMFSHQ